MVHFPDAEVWDREIKAEEVRESAEQFGKDYEESAIESDQFCEDYDTYDYRDSVEDKEENVQAISASIQQGDPAHLKDWLQSVIEEEKPAEDVKHAEELLKKLDDLAVRREKDLLTKVEELEESNYDQIDGTLNNMESRELDKTDKGLSIMEKLEQNKERITRESTDGK